MKYYIVTKRKLYLFILLFIAVLIAVLYSTYAQSLQTTNLVMGARLYSVNHQWPANQIKQVNNAEKYFRPSKLPVLNNRSLENNIIFQYQGIAPADIKISEKFTNHPEDTILNYFSIIREGENLTKEKSAGCGTVGNAKVPFPIAYQFFTKEYQEKVDYKQYLKSFEGIGHTSLIKLKKLPPDQIHPEDERYFVELESIEGSDKGLTYFAYYFGYVYIQKQANAFLISDMQYFGEDFLCAPYHGWYHDAESNVSIRYGNWCNMIEKQYPIKQSGFTKKIHFEGKDGGNYIIEFMNLTNGTDVEVAQYKQSIEGPWQVIYLNPEACVEDKQ